MSAIKECPVSLFFGLWNHLRVQGRRPGGNSDSMRVLVTGTAGFIGAAVAERLADALVAADEAPEDVAKPAPKKKAAPKKPAAKKPSARKKR